MGQVYGPPWYAATHPAQAALRAAVQLLTDPRGLKGLRRLNVCFPADSSFKRRASDEPSKPPARQTYAGRSLEGCPPPFAATHPAQAALRAALQLLTDPRGLNGLTQLSVCFPPGPASTERTTSLRASTKRLRKWLTRG